MGENRVMCLLCGREFGSISSSHLKKCHNITCKEYKSRFPGAELFSVIERLRRSVVMFGSNNPMHNSSIREGWLELMRSAEMGKLISMGTKEAVSSPEQRKENSLRQKKWWDSHPEGKLQLSLMMLEKWQDVEFQRNRAEGMSRHYRDRDEANGLELISDSLFRPMGFLFHMPVYRWVADWWHPNLFVWVEINGCYWHAHSDPICSKSYWPSPIYPEQKDHVRVDKAKRTYCRNRNIPFFEIWECELKDPSKRSILEEKLSQIKAALELNNLTIQDFAKF